MALLQAGCGGANSVVPNDPATASLASAPFTSSASSTASVSSTAAAGTLAAAVSTSSTAPGDFHCFHEGARLS